MPRPTLKGLWSEAQTGSTPRLKIVLDDKVVVEMTAEHASEFMKAMFEDYKKVIHATRMRREAFWTEQEREGYTVDRTHTPMWGD